MQQRPSFESLFRLSPNAYVLLAPDLAILDANDAYLRLTGRRREEILGQRLLETDARDTRDHGEIEGDRNHLPSSRGD